MSAPSPARSRYARRLALVAVAGAGATALVACQKPLPDVTFQSGSRSVLIAPSTYCFDTDNRDSCRGAAKGTTLKAAPGGSINISVPRSVADNAWLASAEFTDNDGKNQVLDSLGSNLVVDNHHTVVPVPNIGIQAYRLTVTEYRGQTPTGTWTVVVDVTN